MSRRKVHGLKASAERKKKQALQNTKEAIDILLQNKQKITIASVARLAGVSTSYIYKYPELAYKIQTLREQQKYEDNQLLLPSNKHHQLIKEYSDRLQDAEEQKAELDKEIKLLKSSIEHKINSDSSVERLQANNVKLTLENQKLKQQVTRLEREVYQLREAILDRGYIDDRDRQPEVDQESKTIQIISSELNPDY